MNVLKQAILRGLRPDGDFQREIMGLGEFNIKSRDDARAVLGGLRQLPKPLTDNLSPPISPLRALAGLFRRVEADIPTVQLLTRDGIPELVRIFDVIVDDESYVRTRDMMFVLKILAMYKTEEGTLKVIEAMHHDRLSDERQWDQVLALFDADHPHTTWLLQSLKRLPESRELQAGILEAANKIATSGVELRHPFDSPAGNAALMEWLDDHEERSDYQTARAAAAIQFLSGPERKLLLNAALAHPSKRVQLEAAHAAAVLGSKKAVKILAKLCHDTEVTDEATSRLKALGMHDAIPAAGRDDEFQAKAKFSRWLSSPSELCCPPDRIEVYDSRTLQWPTHEDPLRVWLLKFTLDDPQDWQPATDIGMVGSITWCFLGQYLLGRPPEDCYAIHCAWEMEQDRLINETEVESNSGDYDGLLKRWKGTPLNGARVERVSEISAQLSPDNAIVAIASATMAGHAGWCVLDGAQSRWYAASDMPNETTSFSVLKIHIGRKLLNFTPTGSAPS